MQIGCKSARNFATFQKVCYYDIKYLQRFRKPGFGTIYILLMTNSVLAEPFLCRVNGSKQMIDNLGKDLKIGSVYRLRRSISGGQMGIVRLLC